MIRIIKSACFLVLLFVSITSCQKEISEESLTGNNNGNNNNNNNNSSDCKACNYYPFCDGSTYTYVDTTATGATTSAQTLEITGDTTVDGKLFVKATTSNSPGTPVSYHNCTAGETTIFGFPQPGNRVTTRILKANEAVGATWTDMNTNAGQSFNYTYTIMSKTLDRTVLGVPYSNVIHVHLVLTVDLLGNIITAANSDYYYAPNVGLIESINIDETSGTPVVNLHRVLQSFHIP